ncbi:hypothetical protein [Longimicrobium sp.]|uniref:hypothetical protein n=1 Tax=Longimicrobium sp. TaxID=2029185 RepID=UPI002E36A6EE|nr:hypothetical protein [Longimicrobium sp.]HEX6037670.1 hypothetical protein [Longimicrobium sp.]
MPDTGTWWYELDAQDHVAAVSGEWVSFGPGSAAAAAGPGVLGQSLWTLLDGIEQVHVLRRIITGVRASGAAVEVPFRCDSPTAERHMQFRVASVPGGRVRITTRLRYELPLAGPPAPRPEPHEGAMSCMCSWCNHIRMADGTWLPTAEGAARLGMFCGARMPAITHGLCAGCLTRMQPLFDDDASTEAGLRTVTRS